MTRLSKLLLASGLVLLGAAIMLTMSPFGRTVLHLLFMKRNVAFDRPHLESVVASVRFFNLQPGERRELRLNKVGDPKSLRLRPRSEGIARGYGAGNVWASREPGGELTVIVQTMDLGHVGASGYAYSEHPTPSVCEHLASLVPWTNLCCREHRASVADRWWEVVANDTD